MSDLAARFSAAASKHLRRVRILTIDVERAPGVAYFWQPKTDWISPEKMISPPRMICFAAKWFGEKDVIFHDERDGHEQMIRAGWDLLTEADIVVTYNGERADIPWFNEHFADYGMGPAAPFKSVDLIKSNKRQFQLPYRRLDYLAGRLLGSAKQHTDFSLWTSCMAGDERAWAKMRSYNEQDVKLTERLYLKMLPWLVDQPHIGLLSASGEWSCPHCGSTKIARYAKKVTAFVRQYALYRCESCQGWSRSQFLTGESVRTRMAR